MKTWRPGCDDCRDDRDVVVPSPATLLASCEGPFTLCLVWLPDRSRAVVKPSVAGAGFGDRVEVRSPSQPERIDPPFPFA